MEAHAHSDHHDLPTSGSALTSVAISATLHCLTGCAIGEVLGMAIGTALGFSNWSTVALAVVLAFFFGYALTSLPLLRAGLALSVVVPIALASDTLSIATMEIVDNAVMVAIPGAMHAGLGELLFWGSLAFALAVAGVVAVPVNRYLIARGKGHAKVHETGIHGGPSPRLVGVIAAAAFVFGSTVLVAEALSEDEPAHGGQHASAGQMSERAFLTEMTAHHQSAIRTGHQAQERGQSRFVRGLGADILRTQAAEVRQMRALYRRLVGGEMPSERMHDGVPARLARARDFDRAFVDHMIPHHVDAVRMSREVRTDDRELRALAAAIVTAQRREIAAMRRFRDGNYGTPEAPSPSGDGHGGHTD
ncbi:MAG TPA: DUF4396 domain-containing protein [Thermoleophilaceae bacterium]|nr:DUF4396 domain-containing protein [Thermoleophilaceae bacterium]